MEQHLYGFDLNGPASVILARRHARRLAAAFGLEPRAQARLAVAVAEVAHNAMAHAGGGTMEFALEPGMPPRLVVRVRDQGQGIPASDVLADTRAPAGSGLAGVRRLVDACQVTTGAAGTIVRLACNLPDGATTAMAEGTMQDAATPADEDLIQNNALLAGLTEIDRLNAELEDTNRGVVALYAELDERAEQLRQASELKSRFLSNMSHEFRTPLNSILALARLLLDGTDGALTEEQEKQVGYIRRSAENLAELVNDLLDLAKVEAGKLELRPQPFTVQALFGGLRGVMKPLQQSDAVDLVFDDAPDCPALFTDEAKVAQVLRNLVSNALKFTERGEVRVSAAFDRIAAQCVFTVRDTGIGIAPENHEVVFQEFSQVASQLQAHAKGTGLGLPLSRRLAELLGGTLTLRSAPGAGSMFTLAIPAILPLAEPIAASSAAISAPVEPGGVLVIDDEEASRYVLRQMLSGLQHLRILEADNGALGLHRAQQEQPDVILLDLRMPAMDGFEVLDQLSANPDTRQIPVVVCTSSVLESADHARLAKARVIVSKSGLTRDTMSAVIRPLLGGGIVRPVPPDGKGVP